MEQGNDEINTRTNTPVSEQNNVMTQGASEKKKSGKGMLYGMILLAILAIGGIGFGVWAMLDGNSQKDALNAQITSLKQQVIQAESETAIIDEKNPVMVAKLPAWYSIEDKVLVKDANDKNAGVVMMIWEGEVSCYAEYQNNDECNITGVPEGVREMAVLYGCNDTFSERIGFLASEGSVWYVDLYNSEGTLNRNMEAQKLGIDGAVKSIINTYYKSDAEIGACYLSLFEMEDGRFVQYDEVK